MRVWCAKADVVSMPVINQYARCRPRPECQGVYFYALRKHILFTAAEPGCGERTRAALVPFPLFLPPIDFRKPNKNVHTLSVLRARVSHAAPDDRNGRK